MVQSFLWMVVVAVWITVTKNWDAILARFQGGGNATTPPALPVTGKAPDRMPEEKLAEILRKHAMFLMGQPDGKRAYLRWANLKGANLSRANMEGANLCGADLERVNMEGANLCGANLSGEYLEGVNLRGADLRGADLFGVRRANFEGALR